MTPWVSSRHAWLTGLLWLLAVILLAGLAEVAGAEPLACAFNQPSVVGASGRQLVVARRRPDGSLDRARPYRMRGVNWAPASRGSGVDERQAQYAIWAATDIPLMREMNVNTVRVYLDFGVDQTACAVLDELHRHGIMAIVTVDLMVNDTANIARIVEAYRNHPAILLWSLGNEWNVNRYYSDFTGTFATVDAAARATELAAAQVKAIDPGHPVASSLGDIDIPSLTPLATTASIVNTVVPSVDVWGLNIYRGASFGTLFSQWASISSRPMFLGEFGTDAFDQTAPPEESENQRRQADFNAGLWDEITANLSADDPQRAAIGGTLFEWNDEWWKDSAGSPAVQDPGGFAFDGHPDGFANEEWFGVVDIDRNTRLAFFGFRARFAASSCAGDPSRLPCVHRQLLDPAVPNVFPGVPTTPVTGVDGDGNVIAAWAYQFSIPGELYTVRYDVATGWGPRTPLDTGAAQDRAFLPSLAVNRSGAALLAWSGQVGIYAAAYQPGSGWQPAAAVVSHPSQFLPFADRLEVTIDDAGNGLLVWSENTSQLLGSRYVAGSGWTAPEVVADRGGFTVFGFSLASDRNGNAVLLWNHKPSLTSGQFTLFASRHVAGGGWQAAAPLWTSDLPISSSVALDEAGGAMAAWIEEGAFFPARHLLAARFVAGGSWLAPELVSDTSRPTDALVDVDSAGNAMLIWRTGFDSSVSVNRYIKGAGWQGIEVLKRYLLGDPSNPRVKLDGHGNAVAVWTSPEVPTRLEARRFLPATGWQAFDVLGDPVKGDARGGGLAMNADGAAVVTWMDSYTVFDGQSSNTFTDVYASRFSIPDVFTLTVAVTGTGGGIVRSDLPGIICPPACVQSYDDGAVTLTASPGAGSVFSGWSGAGCTGTGTCTVTMSGSRTVTATFTSTRPDLIVTGVSPAALAVAPGGRLAVTVTIRNQGEGQAGASTMRFYLSHDPIRGPGDRLLSPSLRFSALAPGGAETRTVAVAMPRAARPGAYVVLACADDLRRVAERDETNNCAASPAAVTVAGPDLVVDAVAPRTSSLVAGQVIVLTVTLRNTGSLQAPSSVMRFYLAGQRQRGPTDLALRGTPFPILGPGRAATRTLPVTIPMTAPAGAYYVLACADDLDRVAERDETDNCLASAAPITITPR